MRRSDASQPIAVGGLAATTALETLEGAEAVSAPRALIAYALALVGAALVAMAVAVVAFPVLPTIAINGAVEPTDAAVAAGMAFWLVFGLAGSTRPRDLAGGAVVTFHMPFVVAATILGGPVMGALMGVISITEPRELRRAPWYGILANHAMCVIAAVVAGTVGSVARAVLHHDFASTNALAALTIGVTAAVTFVLANHVLLLPIIALRTGTEFGRVLRHATRTLRTTMVAELSLAWLMAVPYLSVAWWAPLAFVLVIGAVWDAHERQEALRRDRMTGLLNDAGVQPFLDVAVHESRRRAGRHALLFIDLDRFGKLNKEHGSDVGDDVIRAVALRMAAAVRSTDVVGRQNRAGDEFLILLRDLPDDETARRLAWRVHQTILRPVRVRKETLVVSVGASIGIAIMVPGGTESLATLKRLADERMQQVKRAGGGVLGPPEP
jgi:diguanylate cyclase (GGDEF)-like protein